MFLASLKGKNSKLPQICPIVYDICYVVIQPAYLQNSILMCIVDKIDKMWP